MKVKDLIAKLQEFDSELPVCLADWNEAYREPDEGITRKVTVRDGSYWPEDGNELLNGRFVCIGE